MSIEEFRSLHQIRESSGVHLVVLPEQSRIFLAGFDCFVQDPRIKCAPFSQFEARVVQKDAEGCYVFPKWTKKPDPHTHKIGQPIETQTPTNDDEFAPTAADKQITPFKKPKTLTTIKSVEANQQVPAPSRRKTKQDAIRYLKTSKAMKRSLGVGPEILYRQFRVNNAVVKGMNIQMNPKTK